MFKRLLARIVVVGGFSIAIWTGVNIFFDSTQTVIANRVLDGKPQVLTTWKSKNIGDTITQSGIRYIITKSDKHE